MTISSFQSLIRVRLFETPWIAAHQASLSITNSQSSLRLTSIESVMPSNHPSSVVPFSFCPQSFPATGLFKWVSSSHHVVKVLEFQFQHQSFQWTPRTDLLYDEQVGSPCSSRDSQESSPTPQFKYKRAKMPEPLIWAKHCTDDYSLIASTAHYIVYLILC